ncbi:MAG: exodeoxyribonuclease V subunit gamma, partial [Anaerolineae bacterium]
MALKVIHSNRVECLKDDLAERLAAPPPGAGALDVETILLDNPSLGPWINLQVALSNGVAANIGYQRLATFFWDLTRKVIGGAVPATTPLGEAELRWRLLGLLSDVDLLENDVMEPVRTYLDGSGGNQRHTDLKRFQLASRVADLFDQYQVFRPDWIRHHWDAGKRLPGDGARPRGAVFERAEAWQRALWQQLRAGLRADAPIAHRSDA